MLITNKSVSKISNDIPIYNFNELEPLLYTKTNKTYVINFWAMWCAPCVKELPYIQQYANKNPNVEIILVSLDFPEDIETKLKPFLKQKNITSKVILLDDPDSNSWIDKIDPNWSGAIPFTIIFNNKKRGFFEHTFSSLEDLENTITETLKL
ncbi:TlpA family protein disulfide reductase [Flavivirga jejuensis]|uniref:TlpA disulfide reductase family protein n=1 Tax=Flavivirga jejuensis TaxID=870487 RepID=A0ABT8WQL0_9FLAO|nr:TlpA disulfide reductase family protein [Flavivirga jejuensis]MDO5975428.1 TlpA disulfide reductase family protein [Flavivirga jejuensis]